VRTAFSQEVDAALAEVDALALPTLPAFPLRLTALGDSSAALGMTRLVRPFNLSGHPVLSLAVAEAVDGPISLQLVGRKWDDARLCAVAGHVERAIRFNRQNKPTGGQP
jgi:amidase